MHNCFYRTSEEGEKKKAGCRSCDLLPQAGGISFIITAMFNRTNSLESGQRNH